MGAEHGCCGQALVEQVTVEVFEVLGLEAVEAVASDAGRDVHPHHRLVALQGARSYASGRDVGQPMLEPAGDGVGGDRGHLAGLALDLEVADLLDDLLAGLAAAVAPIALTVGLQPDRDPAVPTAELVLEDRRLAGGCSLCHR
ncbi:MAG TPA: hypothetical protein VGH11_14950 [Jatrophihabitans sp.]